MSDPYAANAFFESVFNRAAARCQTEAYVSAFTQALVKMPTRGGWLCGCIRSH
jgi:hypothetical protein